MAEFSRQSRQLSIFSLIIGCILFGLGSLIVVFLPINSYAIAFWRMGIAGIVFIVAFLWRKERLPSHPVARLFALLAGVFLGLDLALWHESIYAVGPGISTLLNSLQIFFLTAIGLIFFKERLTLPQITSLLLAISGVALIASPEFAHNQYALWGFVSGLISGGVLACSMASIRKIHEIEPTPLVSLMVLVNAGGVIVLLPIALLAEGPWLPHSLNQVGLLLIYGIVMQCFAWTMIAFSIPRLSLALTGLLLLSEPVAALLIDAFVLSKPINAWQWFGVIITLSAIYLGSIKQK